MTGIYKSGVKVAAKEAAVTKVQIAAAFATQMNASLENHAKSLQNLDMQSEVPKALYTPIEDFFASVIQSSDQYTPNLKQLTTKMLKKTLDLKSAVEKLHGLTTRQINQPTTGGRKLFTVLQLLMSDVDHFIQQQEMTHDSYTPGKNPNTGPVNWSIRKAVHDHILDHQSKFGVGHYPNLNAAQIRARSNGHQLSDRTYREIKTMHTNGTLFHYIQPKKRQ